MSDYKLWLGSNEVSEEEKKIIFSLDSEALHDSFYRDLEFGTAGMRGIIGPGSNRLNLLTVRKATYGFGKYLLETFKNAKSDGVVIACDNRHMSQEFVDISSKTLNELGINTYVFESLRPTPELSFAVRELKACGGIMVTASHNPREYNGYKVYDENGCQLVPHKIGRLVEIITSLPSEIALKYTPHINDAKKTIIGEEIDKIYLNNVLSVGIRNELDKSKIKIVYSPEHGTSYKIAVPMFKRLGYKNIIEVASQCTYDPDFSGTKSPNPEEEVAYEEAIKLAEINHADLVVITDPDADRLGIAFLNSHGKYELYTGNQTGALLLDYVLKSRKELSLLKKNPIMFNTIVTSTLGSKIAQNYGVKVESLLTGFKFIGDKIEQYNLSGEYNFEFGYEESYGYLLKDFCRDKDALQALLIISEMTNYYLLQGLRLDEVLTSLEERHGYHKNKLFSIFFKGEEGTTIMNSLLSSLRKNHLTELGGLSVEVVEDYLTSKKFVAGKIEEIHLPSSDVLKFYFNDGSSLAVRPSGTEPKCKFYYEAVGKSFADVNKKPGELHQALLKLLKL